MSGLTNRIEAFLLAMMQECDDGHLEIGRNDLAEKFDCAPSQINYVLTTRFTPYNGYYIESRRGGDGYIRIVRLRTEPVDLVRTLLEDGAFDELTADKCKHILKALYDQGLLEEREAGLMKLALDDTALRRLSNAERKRVRADVLRNMLLVFVK